MDLRTLKQSAKDAMRQNYGMALIISALPPILLSALAPSGIGLILLAPISVGMVWAFVLLNRQSTPDLGVLLRGFTAEGYLNNVVVLLLRQIFIFLWALLLIIPGIVKAYAYAMTPYILADDEATDKAQAITQSKTMMQGHKGQLFWLHLSFIGWLILSVFTLGILYLLYVRPYMMSADARFYETLKATKGLPR